jgi:hypothetical protein
MLASRYAVTAVAVGALAMIACQGTKDRAAHLLGVGGREQVPALAQPFPAGDPRGTHFHFELAVYHVQAPKVDPSAAVRRLASDLQLVVHDGTTDAIPSTPTLFVHAPRMEDYAPPDVQALRYAGRGLSETDKQRLQNARSVTALAFAGR